VRVLELKIPPPAVALLVAFAMWGISLATSRFDMSAVFRNTAVIVIAVVGFAFALSGVLAIRRARTTISPIKPEAATSLVTSGVYRFTRNPMYLGLGFVLLAWAVFLSSAWAFLGPIAFVLYINRFQIAPEERVLSKLFGPTFAEYQSKVRRWL
jgi:protein-S-isoprenylcysteine O-methyltransferase Ste14